MVTGSRTFLRLTLAGCPSCAGLWLVSSLNDSVARAALSVSTYSLMETEMGMIDLIAGNQKEYLGNGDGTFRFPTVRYLDHSLSSLSGGGLDGDGRADLVGVPVVAPGTDGAVEVLLN